LWFTVLRYHGLGFYAWQFAPLVKDVLGFATFGAFVVVAALRVRRFIRTATFPWVDIALVGGAILGLDLLWRFCRSMAWDTFKLTSLGLDIATPLIVLLGLLSLKGELAQQWPKPRQAAT
jgi:hypothetical protein